MQERHTRFESPIEENERIQALHSQQDSLEISIGQWGVLPLHLLSCDKSVFFANAELIEKQVVSLTELCDKQTRFEGRHERVFHWTFIVTSERRFLGKAFDKTILEGDAIDLNCLTFRIDEAD